MYTHFQILWPRPGSTGRRRQYGQLYSYSVNNEVNLGIGGSCVCLVPAREDFVVALGTIALCVKSALEGKVIPPYREGPVPFACDIATSVGAKFTDSFSGSSGEGSCADSWALGFSEEGVSFEA